MQDFLIVLAVAVVFLGLGFAAGEPYWRGKGWADAIELLHDETDTGDFGTIP